MWDKRASDLLAAFIVGNGLLDLIAPRERYSMWQVGPEGLRKAALRLADHPTATRLRGIVRVGIGLWLALRQYQQAPQHWYQRWFSQYRLGGWLVPLGFVLAILLLAAAIYGRSRSKSAREKGKVVPTIARVTELSATSEEGFEDAIDRGVKRATSTLRNVESA